MSEQAPPGTRVMAIVRWMIVAVMGAIAAASMLHYCGHISTASGQEQGVVYYCPMHPSVRQDHPGECPICGMSLVKIEHEAGAPQVPPPAPAASAMTKESYFCPMHPEQGSNDP